MLQSPLQGVGGNAPLQGGWGVDNLQCLRVWLDSAMNQYYLPQSNSFQGKPVRHIILYDPRSAGMEDAIGAPVFSLRANTAASLYLNLKNDDGSDLVRDADLSLLSSGNRDVFIPVGRTVKWENSFIRVRGQLPAQPSVLLLYVVYGGTRPATRRYDVVRQVRIPPSDGPKKLSAYLDAQGYGHLRRLDVVSASKLSGQNYVTLNCRSGRTFNHVPLEFFQGDGGLPRFELPLLLADYNVDWNNSAIVNTDQEILLNLYFGR